MKKRDAINVVARICHHIECPWCSEEMLTHEDPTEGDTVVCKRCNATLTIGSIEGDWREDKTPRELDVESL